MVKLLQWSTVYKCKSARDVQDMKCVHFCRNLKIIAFQTIYIQIYCQLILDCIGKVHEVYLDFHWPIVQKNFTSLQVYSGDPMRLNGTFTLKVNCLV